MGSPLPFWAIICDQPLPNMPSAPKILCLPKLHHHLRTEYSNLRGRNNRVLLGVLGAQGSNFYQRNSRQVRVGGGGKAGKPWMPTSCLPQVPLPPPWRHVLGFPQHYYSLNWERAVPRLCSPHGGGGVLSTYIALSQPTSHPVPQFPSHRRSYTFAGE